MLKYPRDIESANMLRSIQCNHSLVEYISDIVTRCGDYVYRPYGLKVEVDETLPDRFQLKDTRFENDRFTEWFDINNPPEWAINLGVTTPQPCVRFIK